MPYVLKGPAEEGIAGPSGGSQRIGIVCPYADAPQGVMWDTFSNDPRAGDEQVILQGLVLQ